MLLQLITLAALALLFIRNERNITKMVTRKEFDDKLAQLAPTIITAVETTFGPLLTKASQDPDYTSEMETVNGLPDAVASALATWASTVTSTTSTSDGGTSDPSPSTGGDPTTTTGAPTTDPTVGGEPGTETPSGE